MLTASESLTLMLQQNWESSDHIGSPIMCYTNVRMYGPILLLPQERYAEKKRDRDENRRVNNLNDAVFPSFLGRPHICRSSDFTHTTPKVGGTEGVGSNWEPNTAIIPENTSRSSLDPLIINQAFCPQLIFLLTPLPPFLPPPLQSCMSDMQARTLFDSANEGESAQWEAEKIHVQLQPSFFSLFSTHSSFYI